MDMQFIAIPLAWVIASSLNPAMAQERVYRCGNKFSNTLTPAQAQEQKCTLFTGSDKFTVVPAYPNPHRVNPAANPTPARANVPPADTPHAAKAAADQRVKNDRLRADLQAKLKKAKAEHSNLLQQYNGGKPEKQLEEIFSRSAYDDRVANIKMALDQKKAEINEIEGKLKRLQ
ncbi:MAG: hypothetical protein RLZZ495_1125 [Pseudomonadota bacterium]|mgnify:CR=1 FL=1|jgi:hypothetical protein